MAKKARPTPQPAAKRATRPAAPSEAAPEAERTKRPPLPRAEPIRSWSTLFGGAPDASGGGVPPFGAATANGQAPGIGPEAVRRGVEMGYRVVDEYMKQGAKAANSFSSPSRGRPAATEPDLSKMTERMMQYASDFTSLWYDAMGMMMGTMNGQARPDVSKGPGPAESAGGASPQAILGHSRIILDVKSARAVEIIVALDEALHESAFTVEDLKPRTGKSSITGARVEPASEAQGPLKVHVHVAASVAPGRYTGAILDAISGKPKGRLTVTVSK